MKRLLICALALAVILGFATAASERALAFLLPGQTPAQSSNLATASISANPATIPNGGSSSPLPALLTWTSAGATSCAGTGFSTGGATSGSASVSPTTTTTYSVTCDGGSSPASTTVTVSGALHLATNFCAAFGGGNGSLSSPWTADCIQAAFAASSNGDTIFLAAGSWVLPTFKASFTGAISGTTLTVSGVTGTIAIGQNVGDNLPQHVVPGTVITGGSGTTWTVKPSQSISSETMYSGNPIVVTNGINLVGAGSGNTFNVYGNPTYDNTTGTTDLCVSPHNPQALGITCISTIGANTNRAEVGGYIQYFGNAYGGGGSANCANISASHFFIDGSLATAGGGVNGTLTFLNCPGPITVSDIRVLTFNSTAIPSETQFFSGQTNNLTVQNSVLAAPVDVSNPSFYSQVELLEITNANTALMKNNVLYQSPFNPIDFDNVTFTGNVAIMNYDGIATYGGDPAVGIAGCSAPSLCPPNGGTTGTYHFTASNNYLNAGALPFGAGGGVNDPGTGGAVSDLNFVGNWITANKGSISGCVWHIFGSCVSGQTGSVDGMQVNGNRGPSGNCSIDPSGTCFNISNNSMIAASNAILDATGNGILSPAAPNRNHNNTTVNFNAFKNYLSSPGNQYLSDANSVNPHVTGNFCSGSTFTQTDSTSCAASGFTTPPTCSFTLGTLSGSTVPFNSTSFTAQYGAIEWLASTSSTPPTSSGQSGGAQWSFVPPVSLTPVPHGSTVYMWVMDSANHISAPCSAAVP
jgi:hypothetical protein